MKKILALVLMMLLVFSSFPITAFASEPGEADIPLEIEENTGIPLEMEEIDPSTLHVKKLGELESEETPEIEEMTHKPGDIVRVSIFLDGDSVADAGYSLDGIADSDDVDAYRDELKKAQDAVQRRIESALGKDLDVRWNLTLLTNVISAEVLFSDIVRIEHVKGVKSVYIENQYSAEEASETDGTRTGHTYRDMVGAADTWAEGYTGAGSLIAIIDTGIDTTHQSFRSSDFEYSLSTLASQPDLLTKNEVNAVKSKLNGKGGSYVNTKIPFGYNYVDKNTTIDHLSDTQGEHGSHVAGIAAANRYLYSNNQYTEAARLYLAVGMAPDAQLLIMKIFGASGGAYDSDYIAAIEDAIVLGADAINLSLGSVEPGFTYIPGYQDVFNDLSNNKYNSKAVLSVSAGNSRSFATNTSSGKLYAEDVSMNTLGAPASYINSLSVASADNIYKSGSNPIAREDAVISDFSSWGIPGSLLLKPEITAPGGNIRSVYGTNVTA
ncbi:MAG: S8 family serine peptidase, partial [Firmicutes bacterium]|nr:S8 family serine peptidase [Bacillota bacterium]